MNIDSAATKILRRAVELDSKKRYTEALVCYQEGIQMLIDISKSETDVKRSYLRNKIEEYMNRGEKIKEIINQLKEEGKYTEQISIENNSCGHSYESIFGRFLDEEITHINIEDPYVRSFHQCQNLVRFCELVVKKCRNIKTLQLLTSRESEKSEQLIWLNDIKRDLLNYNITLNIEFSPTLHDRQIVLSTGWIIKMGRGLDYFKAPIHKFCLGTFDLDLRPCHETTINIFHSNSVKQKN